MLNVFILILGFILLIRGFDMFVYAIISLTMSIRRGNKYNKKNKY